MENCEKCVKCSRCWKCKIVLQIRKSAQRQSGRAYQFPRFSPHLAGTSSQTVASQCIVGFLILVPDEHAVCADAIVRPLFSHLCRRTFFSGDGELNFNS